MIITNKSNLPQALVRAVSQKPHNPENKISITALLGPIRIRQIKKRYWDKIEVDASDLIWAIFGTAAHEILRSGAVRYGALDGYSVEQYFEVLSRRFPGIKITGTVDLIHWVGIIDDYKTTSMWAIKDGMKAEWARQIRGYAWLVNRVSDSMLIHTGRVIALLKDWTSLQALKYPQMAQQSVVIVEDDRCKNLDKQETIMCTEEYIEDRVEAHLLADSLSDVELPMCTSEEKWSKPDTWAVIKAGAKRAYRVLTNKDEAYALISQLKTGYEVEFRPGEDTRCLRFCDCRVICKEIQNRKGG